MVRSLADRTFQLRLPGVSGIPAFDAAISNKRVQAVQGLLRTFGTATRTATRFLDRYNAAVTQLACAENTAESLVEFEEAGWCPCVFSSFWLLFGISGISHACL